MEGREGRRGGWWVEDNGRTRRTDKSKLDEPG